MATLGIVVAGCSSTDDAATTGSPSAGGGSSAAESSAAESSAAESSPAESSAAGAPTAASGTDAAASSAGSGSGSAAPDASDPAAYIAKLMERPTALNITEPITGDIPKDKTIAYLQCGVPACVENGDALESAATAVGWKVTRIDAGLTAESIKSAWGQAVEQSPDAVVTSGVSRALFEPELAKLAEKKIPVINLTSADDPTNGITVGYGYGPQWTTQGKILADYLVANAGDQKINAVAVTVSAYANIGMIADGLKTELTAQCADCALDTLDVPVSSIGSDLPSRITSYLAAHPDVNWVYVGFADMLPGVPAALKSAGLGEVKIVTIDQSPTVDSYIKNGQSVVMSAGFDVHEMMWRAVDYLARTWTGASTEQNTAVDGLPVWVFTKDNIPSTTEYFPYVADFEAQYKKLWGVS
ncbi:sugar ABC transporter substrate-binding protein [Nakamurella lactea]|uniref:sugar ABC transporter substrate-binding protein n=1 Tax=Nakamurella lactea TaxID=459515 RepID=UPI00041C64DE|nr:substrate-binding domain-containing protein [Nakamurella lactea]